MELRVKTFFNKGLNFNFIYTNEFLMSILILIEIAFITFMLVKWHPEENK